MLVDGRLFDVEPYRGPSHVAGLVGLVHLWNQRDSQEPLLFEEYNWAQRNDARWEWRRCYGTPTDGTHRAAAASELGVQTWVTVTRYAFEARGVERLGLPPDRVDLANSLVPADDPPRPAHEVVELSTHDPRTLIAKATPDIDGLLGFGDAGGVMRVRLFETSERSIVLFSATRRALGASPYGTTLVRSRR